METLEFDTSRSLEAAFREMVPCFEGRESEQNWQQRERSITKLKKITAGRAPYDLTAAYIAGVRSLLDGILKTVNSLRTTLCTAGCSLLQDIANAAGSGIDNMVDILLQNLIKLCANTKPIARTNANEVVLAILSNVSYHLRLMNHIHGATQDKNSQPRRFACGWLKKIIKKHQRHVIEHAGGLDMIEKSLKIGLQDRDKEVREAMRPTFWAFARRWPEKSNAIMSNLDKSKQEQLLADESNPNRTKPEASAEPAATEEPVNFSKSTSAASGKPSLKEVKARLAAQKKAKTAGERPASAQSFTTQSFEDVTSGHQHSQAPANFSKSISSASHSKAPSKEPRPRAISQKRSPIEGRTQSHSVTESTAKTPKTSSHRPLDATADSHWDGPRHKLTSQASKPSFKDVKVKLTAHKKTMDDELSVTGGHFKSHSASDVMNSPEKAMVQDPRKPKSRPAPGGGALSPTLKGSVHEDLISLPPTAKPITQRKHNVMSDRPNSADGPHSHGSRHPASTISKHGNLTSAPMRPPRRPVMRKAETEPSNTATLDLGDLQDLEIHSEMKVREEPLGEDEIPDGQLMAEKISSPSATMTRQEVFNVHEAFEAVKQRPPSDVLENPMHNIKLLESAQVRIQARSLDVHGFRKLQNLIRGESSNATIWQDGYKIEELLLPLLEWLELPLPQANANEQNHILDIQTQLLSTIRLILKRHTIYAKAFFAHSLSTLLVSREHFTGKEHIVSGLEDTVDFIVANCNPKECVNTICDMVEHDLGTRAYELALHTLSSLLHRLHKAPTKGGLGQYFAQTDDNLARRLGRITTALLEDQDLVTRRAAIEVALELYYCVPEDEFFKLVTRQNENHRNVLLYYLSRHKKVHDDMDD